MSFFLNFIKIFSGKSLGLKFIPNLYSSQTELIRDIRKTISFDASR